MQIKIERVFSVERCFEKQKRNKQSHSFEEIGLVMITRARHQTECVETVVMHGPIAEVQQLAKATVAEIAGMQLNRKAEQRGKQKAARALLKEGATGTYNGKKVVFKNGEWVYAE